MTVNARMTHVKRALDAHPISDTPVTSDTPLYAVMLPSGHIEVIPPEDIEDLPRYTLTPAGREELPHEH